ncbi:MAG: hypothetical protein JXL85_05925 [Bacilli bacterium]|nr:hypothetical protein [Bacilli bacterium]
MNILFLFGHIVVFFVASALFNFHKIKGEERRYVWLLSFLEALATYFFIAPFFLYNFMGQLWIWILHFPLGVGALIGVAYLHHEVNEDSDWIVETFKNNILIFMQVLLPFYIFLTIYQNQDLWMQITFSLVSTSVIFFIAMYLRKILENPAKWFFSQIKNTTWLYVSMWVLIGVLIAYLLFFYRSDNQLAVALNLDRRYDILEYIFFYRNQYFESDLLYNQFSLLVFIPVLFSMAFSFTNYRKYLYTIDIKTSFKHDEEIGGIAAMTKKQE